MPSSPSFDKPELREVRIGVMPLSDAAAVLMASALGFDRRHGVRIVPVKQNAWATLRDRLVGGELDMAQALYGMVYATHLGVGGPRHEMAVLMGLNRNGQAITLSRALAAEGVVDGGTFAAWARGREPRPVLAQTFPTGTHALWLAYWLAAHGLDPVHDVHTPTVPPPQMAAQLREGRIHGYCAGEPWNGSAVADGTGVTVATSQQIWPDHPEKVLATRAAFADAYPQAVRATIAAILEAARWIDAGTRHRRRAAELLAAKAWLDLPLERIEPRVLGLYDDGLGRRWTDAHRIDFFDDGAATFPWLSDGMWFLTQMKRWGLLREHPDYLGVARALHRIDAYRDAAMAVKVNVPAEPLRRSTLIDGRVWDGRDPRAYADAFVRPAPVSKPQALLELS